MTSLKESDSIDDENGSMSDSTILTQFNNGMPKYDDDKDGAVLTCESCGKTAATVEPCLNLCYMSYSAQINFENQPGIEENLSQSETKLRNLMRNEHQQINHNLTGAVVNGSGRTDLETRQKKSIDSGQLSLLGQLEKLPSTSPSIYYDASSDTEITDPKLPKSVEITDLSDVDEASRVPERSEYTEIFDPETIPKLPRRHHRKKWCCCCCQKKKVREMSGGDQFGGSGSGGLKEEESSESISIFPSCMRMNDQKSVEATAVENRLEPPKIKSTHPRGAPRRSRIPDRPSHSLNLWSLLKNSVGKELTKVAMPVNFSEPLSMLQRLTEDYEYSAILDTARNCSDPYEQMCYVAAFTISSYATTAIRTGKPFNPLLGETFECDRMEDLGWRCISEQVSHHPPTCALYCEGKDWQCWQEFTMSSKFRGNYLEIIPLGIAHLKFSDGNHYTWRKVKTIIHNLVIGKLWIEQDGEMLLTNHTNGITCQLKYVPYSMFNKKQKEVVGSVVDPDGFISWHINGTWDIKVDAWKRNNPKKVDSKPSKAAVANEVSNGLPLWNRRYPPPESDKYYNFTEFASQLNELEEGVAPTDSRLRPDQRLMENGNWDQANLEKVKVEEKQRAAKKKMGDQENKPVWFEKEKDPIEGSLLHVFKGEYWKCKEAGDWSRCPDIF